MSGLKRRGLFWLAAFLVLWILPDASADLVSLNDGRVFEGRVEEAGDLVKLHFKNGTVEIPVSSIKNILVEEEGKLDRRQQKERKKIEKAIKAMREHSAWRSRYVEESKHFEFNFNVTPEIAQEYIDLMEGIYKDFTKKLKVRLGPGVKRKKMEINIFRDKENFDQVGGVPSAAGFWNFVDERLFFYHDRNDPEYVRSVLLHEFTHLLTHLIKPKFCHPIWCNEGIAEYFGATRYDEKGKLVFGGMQEGRLVSMNAKREDGFDYHLEELMKVPNSSFGGLQYAFAWSAVHFFMETPKYRSKFMKYYVGLATKSGIRREMAGYDYPTVRASEDIAHFKKVFGMKNLDKLNAEWHDYIDANLSVTTGAGFLYEAKNLYWRGKNDDALDAVKTAEDKLGDEATSLVFQYKGLILKRLGRYEAAKVAFREAIRLDPLNADLYYQLGDSLEEMGDKDLLEEAIRNKNLALEIEPDNYDLRYNVERDALSRKKKDDRYAK